LEHRLHQGVAGALDLIEDYRIRAEEKERRRLGRQEAKDRMTDKWRFENMNWRSSKN
tara:strand:- start:4155 stop:4325 length:171 start_codon:yes stop_codon:yes gene_type:complete